MSSAIEHMAVGDTGGVGVGSSRLQLSTASVKCKLVKLIADGANGGRVYFGGSDVTAADSADDARDTTEGLCLVAGADSGWMPYNNLNEIYVIGSGTGQRVTYLYLT